MLLFYSIFQVPDLVFFYSKYNFYFNCCSNITTLKLFHNTMHTNKLSKVCFAKCNSIINKILSEEPPKISLINIKIEAILVKMLFKRLSSPFSSHLYRSI